jgi:hypothetical protein
MKIILYVIEPFIIKYVERVFNQKKIYYVIPYTDTLLRTNFGTTLLPVLGPVVLTGQGLYYI